MTGAARLAGGTAEQVKFNGRKGIPAVWANALTRLPNLHSREFRPRRSAMPPRLN